LPLFRSWSGSSGFAFPSLIFPFPPPPPFLSAAFFFFSHPQAPHSPLFIFPPRGLHHTQGGNGLFSRVFPVSFFCFCVSLRRGFPTVSFFVETPFSWPPLLSTLRPTAWGAGGGRRNSKKVKSKDIFYFFFNWVFPFLPPELLSQQTFPFG